MLSLDWDLIPTVESLNWVHTVCGRQSKHLIFKHDIFLKPSEDWISIPGLEVIKLFHVQLSMKFVLFINVKMPTIILLLAFYIYKQDK